MTCGGFLRCRLKRSFLDKRERVPSFCEALWKGFHGFSQLFFATNQISIQRDPEHQQLHKAGCEEILLLRFGWKKIELTKSDLKNSHKVSCGQRGRAYITQLEQLGVLLANLRQKY